MTFHTISCYILYYNILLYIYFIKDEDANYPIAVISSPVMTVSQDPRYAKYFKLAQVVSIW